MKKITTRIATVLLLGALCAVPVFAKAKSRVLTVGQDFVVGTTAVKAGTYRFSIDEATNELTVSDKKTKEVIARAETRSQSREKGSFGVDIQLVDNNGTKTLASISFDGEKQTYALVGGAASAR